MSAGVRDDEEGAEEALREMMKKVLKKQPSLTTRTHATPKSQIG
jgi:hypothetical protein